MIEIELSRAGFKTLIDDNDYELVNKFRWGLLAPGPKCKYARATINGKDTTLHRFLLKLTDPKLCVDHINGDGLDNRRANLRITNKSGNARNIKKDYKFKGIYLHKKNRNFVAAIKVNYKKIHIGCFPDEVSAARAYNEAAKKYFGEFASLNSFQG